MYENQIINDIGAVILLIFSLFLLYKIVLFLYAALMMQSKSIKRIAYFSILWIILVPMFLFLLNEIDRYGYDEPHIVIIAAILPPIYIGLAYALSRKLDIFGEK